VRNATEPLICNNNPGNTTNTSCADLHDNNLIFSVEDALNTEAITNNSITEQTIIYSEYGTHINDEQLPTTDANDEPLPTIKQLHAEIISRNKPSIQLHHHPETLALQKEFNSITYNYESKRCEYCFERWCNMKGDFFNNKFECRVCSDSLQDLELNDIEELFISRIHVVMKVYRLEKGNAGYKGNILNMEQDLQTALNKLPLLPSELPVFLVRKSNPSCSNRYKDFRIRRDNILK